MKLHKTLPEEAYLEVIMDDALKEVWGFTPRLSAESERRWLEVPHSLRRDVFFNVGNYSFLLVQFFLISKDVRISSKNQERIAMVDEQYFLELAETTEIVDIEITGAVLDIHLSNGVVI